MDTEDEKNQEAFWKECEEASDEIDRELEEIFETKRDDPKYRDLIEEYERLHGEAMAEAMIVGSMDPGNRKAGGIVSMAVQKSIEAGGIEARLLDMYEDEKAKAKFRIL